MCSFGLSQTSSSGWFSTSSSFVPVRSLTMSSDVENSFAIACTSANTQGEVVASLARTRSLRPSLSACRSSTSQPGKVR